MAIVAAEAKPDDGNRYHFQAGISLQKGRCHVYRSGAYWRCAEGSLRSTGRRAFASAHARDRSAQCAFGRGAIGFGTAGERCVWSLRREFISPGSTGSAAPLNWAEGQYLCLAQPIDAGYNLDTPSVVKAKYRGAGPILGAAGKCTDDAGASTDDGAAIQVFACNKTAARSWA